uniref:Gastrin/cholecystokinin type B receptor n=1 Tax=Corvus moneduloides TaxID=1196302 RepID=A0A8C3D8A0_CORMO
MDPRPLNESLQEMLCRSGNGTGNGPGTGTGTNGSVCDLLRRGLRGPPAPRELDVAVRVVLYALIFVLSVGGNALVVAVLALNRRLRTVTNCFLLSLALSDLLLALCCMPFTLLPGLMGAFIFGDVVCKLVAYLMGVSVAVSTFSLVAIAIERYSAICNPLQSRAWQTRSHACRVIAGTWALAALLMLPYAVYSTTRPAAPRPPPAQCTHHWPSERVRQVWYVLLLLVLFFIPGVVMTVAYGLISRELYRGIRFELDVKREVAAQHGIGGDPAPACDEGDGCYLQLSRPGAALELRALGAAAQQDGARINSSGGPAGGQAARDPHAGGHRGHVLPLLAAHLRRQHLASLCPAGSPAGTLGDPHRLHPPALVHLSLRQPPHLLLHEPPLPQGLWGHLCGLGVPPRLPPPPARGRAPHGQRLALQVQLHYCQQPGTPLSRRP